MNGCPSPIRSLRRPCRTAALAVAAALSAFTLLAACAETGDFARPRPSIWNELILPTAGAVAARGRGEPVSGFPFTDDEDELRDRAWRFLTPAHERAWFDRHVARLTRARILPIAAHPTDRTAYHDALLSESFRSPASRYRRLGEDAVADALLVGPFAETAARVLATDKLRLKSLLYVRDLSEADVREAAARVAENRCLITWVRVEAARRTVAYRYALEHLLIAAPQGEAVDAERAVAALDDHRLVLDALPLPPLAAACAGALDGVPFAPRGEGRGVITK